MKEETKPEVTLESLSDQLTNGLSDVNKAIEKLAISTAKGFASVDERFEQVDKRFEQVDKRFEQVDKRLERVDYRLDAIEKDLNIIKTDVAILKTDLLTVDAKYPPISLVKENSSV